MADEKKTEDTKVEETKAPEAAAETPATETKPEETAHGEQAPGVAETPEVAAAQAEANLENAGQKAEEQARKGGRSNRGGGGRDNRGGGRGRGGRDNRGGRGRTQDDDGEELIEKLVHINRVSKTVKGGKRFGFAALVVVGDGKGKAGFGSGKAREVPEAINKATAAAKKAMVRVPLKEGRTLHHDGKGHFGAGKVVVRSAPPGTGIIAGGPMRAVFESLGVADVVTKSNGTANPFNMIRATFEALKDQTSPRSVAQRRGKKVADLLGRGGMDKAEAEATADAVTE
ncbi:30S ribosomal protein S5 [Sphingomicrobium sp. XHP0235]|uniref:30S ribosomal protein S5 n=1 Tax=Sphingomicrobium aquimarinum TaxID=3133971 RepID=UPI0031FE9864